MKSIKHTEIAKKREVAIIATVAVVDVIVVTILNISGAAYQTSAAFAVGIGLGAVVAYIILTNKEHSGKTKK
ncbi:MAG TPA: hypothetical protein VMR34_01670 [Candidatus Saccharimonadales bacterium]|nr:hypothetical protein [Candidatus Saccharimonadales bacterium]